MRETCEKANPECKYFEMKPPPELRGLQLHGCFTDRSHLIPRRAGTCALSRYVIGRPENSVQQCRAEHDEVNHRESLTGIDDYPLPTPEAMAALVEEDIDAGIHIPTRVARRLDEILETYEIERYWDGNG